MTDNLQNTPDTTQPKRRGKHLSQALQRSKKKFSPTKLVLTSLLVAAPFVIDFVEDRIPWSWLNDAEKRNKWLLASSSVDHLKQALASGMPLEYKDNTITLLHFSVFKDGTTPEKFQKKSELVRAMAEAGADLDAEWQFSSTPLSTNLRINSRSDWKKTGDLLIELGADVNGQSGEKKRRCSPLDHVVMNAPDALPKKDADNSSFDINQHRLDLIYIKRGLDPPEPVESFDPLWEEKIRWLVSRGARFDGVSQATALGTAIRFQKSPEVFALLLELGADPDPQGLSMIIESLRGPGICRSTYRCRHSTEIVRMLINAGADVNRENKRGYSPLLTAAWECCEHNLDIIPMLLSAGAKPEASGAVQGASGVMAPVLRAARENEALQGTHALELIEKAVAAAEIKSATVKR
ncbi:MAG: hypothetical protein AAEJ04_02240 [Planctomycetota bacterium]